MILWDALRILLQQAIQKLIILFYRNNINCREVPGTDFFCVEIWKATYQMTFGRSLELISVNEVFTTLIGFCARQTQNKQLDLTGLMDLLFLIRYRPEDHEKESMIWNETVATFSTKISL